MRLLFTLLMFAILIPVYSQPEGFYYGGKFGLGESRFEVSDVEVVDNMLLVTAGFATTYQFNENFGIMADLLFTRKGGKVSGSVTRQGLFGENQYPYEETYHLFHAEVPVMAKAAWGFGNFYLKIFSGPGLNFNLFAWRDREYDDPDFDSENGFKAQEVDDIDVTEFSLSYGIGADVYREENGIFFLDIRRSVGINSFGRIQGGKAFNKYIALSAGYMF